MANNYLQFSEEISNTTPEERAWFDKIYNLEPGIDTYDGPEGLDLNEEEVDRLGWGFDFSHGDEGTWINAEESGDPDLVGKVVHTFIKKFRPNYTFRLTWAETCSSMRIGQFSGGCLVVDKDGYEAISAWTLADCSSKVLKEICNLMEKPNADTSMEVCSMPDDSSK